MSNSFYNYSGNFIPGQLARAEAVAAEFNSVAQGFSRLSTQGVDTGIVNAYVVATTGYPVAAYQDGNNIQFEATHSNTGPSTISVNSIPAVPLLRFNGTPLVAGDVVAGAWYACIYSALYGGFTILSPTAYSTFAGTISLAAPTHLVGLTAAAGSSTAAAPIDATFAIDQAITPTWTGLHTFNGGISVSGTPIGGYPRSAAEISAGVTPTNYTYQWGNVLRYGADSTGGVDSTAAATAAHATGYVVYYPRGVYKVSSGVSIPGGGMIGDGSAQSIISITDTGSANVFTFTGTAPGQFRDIQFVLAATKTGGYAVVVQPASGENANSRFDRLVFTGIPNGVSFVAASQWVLHACNFLNSTGDSVTINNTNNSDSGDSTISDCIFNNSTSTSANAVHQIASGGLKILGNKFNNGGVGYLLDLGTAGSTSDLIITGNSFENAHFSAIQLQRTSGVRIFTNLAISGNQFLVASASGASAGIYTNNGSTFLSRVTIASNVFFVTDTGAAAGIVLDWVGDATIAANTLTGSGGASIGVSIGGNGSNITFADSNNVRGFGTNFSGTTSVNGLIVGNPTGGQKGVGTLNVASGLYVNNVAVVAGGVASIAGTANQIAASASTGAVTLSLPQNIIIPTPASGVALTVTGVVGSNALSINDGGAQTIAVFNTTSVLGGYLQYSRSGSSKGFIGDASALEGGTLDDFCIRAANGLDLATNNGSQRIHIAIAGNVTVNGPTTGIALTVNGFSGTHSTKIADSATSLFNAGFLEIPQNSKSAAYTIVLSDSGKHIYHPSADTTARTWTIDSNANVAYPIGTAITFDNDTSAGVITLAITTDTLVWLPAGTTGSRFIAAGGQATALKVTATRWHLTGVGIT